MSVDTVVWPEPESTPEGYINRGASNESAPFAVLTLDRGARVQFPQSVPPTEQARWLRVMAEVATRLADELDPNEGTQA